MDRRQVKTQKAILQAFHELLREKPVDRITVRELAERANIGKSTFYAHFETKDHLIMAICQDFFCHLKESEASEDFPDLAAQLLHLLWHLDEEGNQMLRLIKAENTICNRYFCDYLQDIFESNLIETASFHPDLALHHLVQSFLASLRWHILHPKQASHKELVQNFLTFQAMLLK